jgi:hypothetical protein
VSSKFAESAVNISTIQQLFPVGGTSVLCLRTFVGKNRIAQASLIRSFEGEAWLWHAHVLTGLIRARPRRVADPFNELLRAWPNARRRGSTDELAGAVGDHHATVLWGCI